MKRFLLRLVFFCLLLLLGGAGWKLYQWNGEIRTLSHRLSEVSEEYGELSGEHTELSGKYTELSEGIMTLLMQYAEARGHGTGATESFAFTESNRALRNPNRGFYHMHGFRITDVESDFRENIAKRFAKDGETSLTLIEVNLQAFRKGEISEKGLKSLDNLFEALGSVDKQLILRFLYDWDGKNSQYEPDSLDVILGHMEQVSPWLKEHENQIFLLQSLFIGNWGEMNGTKFLGTEELQALAGKLYQASGDNTFLSVRMPAQWRKITEIADPGQVDRGDNTLASRMGLFNDGMLGSWSDYGTYGNQNQAEHGPYTYWNRQEELAFQDVLCRLVPNGGEVVIDNEYNDFENAVADMKAMHVTYLNRDYDTKVMDKWEKSIVQEGSCFDGMDGLTYMERHLGYRLVLRESALNYDWRTDRLSAEITVQNVGFAPVYREAEVKLVLYDRERGREYVYLLSSDQDIRSLAGGTESQELMTLSWELPMGGLPQGELEVYFSVADVLSEEMILFGNEQDPERLGYRVGTLKLGGTENLSEQLRKELFPRLPDVLTGGEDERRQ